MKRVLSRALAAAGLALGLAAVPAAYAADAAPAKPDAAKGGQLYDQGDPARGVIPCSSCHGPAGNSTIPANPNLAGMPHEYLVKQLAEFKIKDGAKQPLRRGPGGDPTPMTVNVKPMTDADILNVALYLSQQPVKEMATAGYKDRIEPGRKIWRAGIPERGVPACASCHGAAGAGMPSQYPRLAGQFPSYLEAQLNLFRSGDRANSEPMADIASRMTDAQIKAVADYAAGLR
jgi:cytochrome c553